MEFFPKATEWLADKAGAASINWNALAAKGQDSVFNTQYMDQYLLPAFNRCSRVVDTLDLRPTTPADVFENYFDLKGKISEEADSLLQVVGAGVQATVQLSAQGTLATVPLMIKSYQTIIWHMWAMALTSANMHITGQIHKSGIPDADIAYHASLTTMMFNVITRMDDFGLLKPMKKSGLGAVPLAALIVLGAVAIVALAWAIVAIFEISQRNEVVKAACVKATESGDPAAIESCQKLFSNPEGSIAGQIPKSISDVVQKISMVAMAGAGIYLLVQFGPGIATKLKQSVSAWKSA